MRLPAIFSIGNFLRLPCSDRWLPLEATICTAVSGLAIAVLPFRYLGFLAARPISKPEPTHQLRMDTVTRIRLAIVFATQHVPWRVRCFQQGLAAQLMLRRRGIPSVLYYGARSDLNGLSAHVWVRDGDIDVIGGEVAYQFAVLATFPPLKT